MHWACEKCLVRTMCNKKCYRLYLPHPYCDEICNMKKQEKCGGNKYTHVISCTKVNRLRIKRGTFFGQILST